MKLIKCIVSSAMAPLDTVGVLTVQDRKEQEPELHLVLHLQTATNQVRINMSRKTSASNRLLMTA